MTSTEVLVRLRRPPTVFPTAAPWSNYFRFRILPRQTIAFGVTAMDEADQMVGQRAELVASRQPGADEKAAYERVLSDALAGDAALFARMDYVEEAWRIVDPVPTMNAPVREYEPGTWGPADRAGHRASRGVGEPVCRRGSRRLMADVETGQDRARASPRRAHIAPGRRA